MWHAEVSGEKKVFDLSFCSPFDRFITLGGHIFSDPFIKIASLVQLRLWFCQGSCHPEDFFKLSYQKVPTICTLKTQHESMNQHSSKFARKLKKKYCKINEPADQFAAKAKRWQDSNSSKIAPVLWPRKMPLSCFAFFVEAWA